MRISATRRAQSILVGSCFLSRSSASPCSLSSLICPGGSVSKSCPVSSRARRVSFTWSSISRLFAIMLVLSWSRPPRAPFASILIVLLVFSPINCSPPFMISAISGLSVHLLRSIGRSLQSIFSHSKLVGGAVVFSRILLLTSPARRNASSTWSCRLSGAYWRRVRRPLISPVASVVPTFSSSLAIVPTNSGTPCRAHAALSSVNLITAPNTNS